MAENSRPANIGGESPGTVLDDFMASCAEQSVRLERRLMAIERENVALRGRVHQLEITVEELDRYAVRA